MTIRRNVITFKPEVSMRARLAVWFIAAAVLCTGCGSAPVAAEPIVLAGATGGVCAAQFEKCTARCRGSGVCTERCVANDRACRAGGKPVYH
jgi:hypothetical protein